jgi:hypothetical protein
MCLLAEWPLDFGLRVYVDELYLHGSNKQEDIIMEHTSIICNMIDKPKHLTFDFIHEIEEPATMKMSFWNAQQMAKKIDNRSCYKMLQKRLQ